MENQIFPTLSVISDRSELSGIGISTLEGIARRLQAMGQRTPRGGLRWSRSSVKNLLDRAREQGLVREGQWA